MIQARKDLSWRGRLSDSHRRMLLVESAISGRTVVSRGYRTATSKAELERLGFGRSQRNVPALVCPVYSPTGEISLYLARPDEPRIKNGKPVKYEIPSGGRMALDVPPTSQARLGDLDKPLFITEGVKKADALASRGLAAVALVGVWNFRGRNESGGKVALPEWESIALNGRAVYIVFDSDVMEKKEVYGALVRLKDFLEHREAKVRLIYLPPAEGGSKQGVDDFFAAGGTVEALHDRATTELKRPPTEEGSKIPYRATKNGLLWDKPISEGTVPTPLTNFTATITAENACDDGAEIWREFEITAELSGREHTFTVPAHKFAAMNWPTEHLGASALLYPGATIKDHARAAIQMLSGDVPSRHVYAHTGWREIGGEWAYLHSGGAIGQDGQVENITTELSGALVGHSLPAPPEGEDLVRAVRASMGLWSVAPTAISVTLLSATYRAALGDSDFSLHLSGPTGEGKTALGALFGQHFGAGLDSRNLTSWESTENAIEGQAFAAKDQVMILDDFAPTGSSYDIQRWHKKADRVLRAKGNLSGRQRMRPDESLKPERPPRALILSTGEDIPRGQSLRARMMVGELSPGDLDWGRLAGCQRDAADGLYAAAMAAFIRWLAPKYEEIRGEMAAEHAELREAASSSTAHRRTPSITADLALGLRYFLIFSYEAGALSAEQAERGFRQGWEALGEAAAEQGSHQEASEPTRRFRELLGAAVASGRAHVASPDGEAPEPEEGRGGAWGWYGEDNYSPADEEHRITYRPRGDRIGWIDGEDLYLEPEASFTAAQKQGRDSGEPLTVGGRTLRKRLAERGLLASTGADEGREALAIRRELEGRRRSVLHTPADFLSPHYKKPDQPDHEGVNSHTYGPSLWSGFIWRPDQPDQEPDHRAPNGQVLEEGWSGNGQVRMQNLTTIIPIPAGLGQVGQVLKEGEGDDVGGVLHTLTAEEVYGEICDPTTGAHREYQLYLAGELEFERGVELITCATLFNRRGWKTFFGWREHAQATRAALSEAGEEEGL